MAAAAVAFAGCAYAEAFNMTGTWALNVEKSNFGGAPAPKSAVVHVTHNEPNLHYTVDFTDPEGKTHSQTIDGVLDGKSHAQSTEQGGTMTMTRLDDHSYRELWTSTDGKTTEDATLTISPDGKTANRKVTVKGPQGTFEATELYEKQ